jgi:uncharacterized protein (TIGR02677 family)
MSPQHSDLLRHVTADKAPLYRAIMETFASAKRQFRLQLRPDEVRSESQWDGPMPAIEEIQLALNQLVLWGNLQAQQDMARVSTVEDYYRKQSLYSLTVGGEAAETGLASFAEALRRRGELQSVALEDILACLTSLKVLASQEPLDVPKAHQTFRDLVAVSTSLAENAQAFMAGLARGIELRRAEVDIVMAYKSRLVNYLQRFIADLAMRSPRIANEIEELKGSVPPMLEAIAAREARDSAPEDATAEADARAEKLKIWQDHWDGVAGWFIATDRQPAQADLLRGQARAAIPRLISAIAALTERSSGRSDRFADYMVLARWFLETPTDAEANRLWRAAFALNPARHLSLVVPGEGIAATTPWPNAPSVKVLAKLRERGQLLPRGQPPRMIDRSKDRETLAQRISEESRQVQAARERLATGEPVRLSQIGFLDRHEFQLFLQLLAEALASQSHPDKAVERVTLDGLLSVRLEPLPGTEFFSLESEFGWFHGRDHVITIKQVNDVAATAGPEAATV